MTRPPSWSARGAGEQERHAPPPFPALFRPRPFPVPFPFHSINFPEATMIDTVPIPLCHWSPLFDVDVLQVLLWDGTWDDYFVVRKGNVSRAWEVVRCVPGQAGVVFED